jgi:hypothetical protein
VYLSVNGQIVETEEVEGLPPAHVTNFGWVPIVEGNAVLTVVAADGEGQSSEPVNVNVVIEPVAESSADPQDGGDDAAPPTDTPEPPTATPDVPTNTPPPTATWTNTPHPPTPTLTFTPTTEIVITLNPGIIVTILPQVETVWDQVSVPANDYAVAAIQCPAESTVVGGGFATNQGVYVYTHSMNDNGWRAYGSNFNASNKLLNVYAVCMKYVSNASITQIVEQVSVPANSTGSAVAACPWGSTLVSGGYASKNDGTLRVYTSTKKDNGWQVYALNESGGGQLLNAYAVCLHSDKTTSSDIIWQGVDIPANSTKGTNATCPSGDYATGGGFAGFTGIEVYNSTPKEWNVWEGYAYNSLGQSKLMNVYAVCLSFD